MVQTCRQAALGLKMGGREWSLGVGVDGWLPLRIEAGGVKSLVD